MVTTFAPALGVEVASSLAEVEVGALAGVVGRKTVEWFVATSPEENQNWAGRALGKVVIQGGTGGDQTVDVLVNDVPCGEKI